MPTDTPSSNDYRPGGDHAALRTLITEDLATDTTDDSADW